MMETMSEDRSEIAFFDVETTVPTRPGQGFALLEFGVILVCPRKLVELRHYSKLVRPTNPNLITLKSVRCNGITGEAIRDAPFFAEIADIVFDLLHGRIWAGHNIVRFDIVRIKEAFAEIGRPAPEPKGIIDSLVLLTQRFGKRAGDMKMATLAAYFGIGKQTHRSLDDVRMNLEVVKYCATVLFLESSLPDIFTEKSWVSPNAITRSRRNERSSLEVNTDVPSSSSKFENISILSVEDHRSEGNHPILSLMTSSTAHEVPILEDPFDMGALSNQMNTESLRPDVTMEEKTVNGSSEMPSVAAISEGSSGSTEFLEPNEVTISSICASFVPHFHGGQRMILLHKNVTLQLLCPHLKIRFGLSTKFVDHAGRPKLNFMVDAPPSLCGVLEACDGVAQKQHADSSSSSDWNRVVTRNKGYENRPVVRLHIPTAVNGDVAQYGTEMYQKEPSGTLQKLVFSKFDPADLATWFNPGTILDAYLSLSAYDFQQKAGIKLVAKKLIIHKQ